MTKSDFMATLQSFAADCKMKLVPAGEDAFELKLYSELTNRRVFVRPCMTVDGSNVGELHYRCLCGAVEDPRAFGEIVKKNFGGVMGTEFYFSGKVIDQFYYLFLETRLAVDPSINGRDDMMAILTNLFMNPLFMMEWEFPQGVNNFLW